MDKVCDDWETGYPPDTPGTWLEFKRFFTKKFFNYQNHQASLSDAGVANSIVSNTAVNSIYAKLASLRAAAQTKDEQLSLLVDQLQPTTVTVPTVSDTASLPSIVPTPTIVPNTPDITTVIQQCVAQALAAQPPGKAPAPASTGRANNRRNNQHRVKAPRTTRLYNNSNYCWTHGCDIHINHTSSTCKHPAPGHRKDATLTNMMGGSTQYLNLVCVPAPLQRNT
mmetsp:Transcript_117337/g.240039  ORF Transcript_117337/g.240039 Transcript_117337/m.240039 type:complete len:224 (-) Transcript_117337:66-737(-)